MQRDEGYLYDILHEARTAREFVGWRTFEEFEKDKQCQYAVIRAIEVIGEAAGRISEEFREAHSEVPWRRMIGMRNRLIHGYGDIVLSTVWEVVSTSVPELIRSVEALLPPEA
jgi:uncharacterized protein with HEPN domain